jgi:ribosomal protein L37AE/L43A
MSRWGYSDADRDVDADELLTAICSDCGADYVLRADDETPVCDTCADRRARWAAQIQLRMAKADVQTVTRAVVLTGNDAS